MAALGAKTDGINLLREGLAQSAKRGATLWQPSGLAALAELMVEKGDIAEALAAVKEALERAETTGEHWWDAELYRLHGKILLAQNKREEAQAALQHSLEIARRQQTKWFELRGAISLARMWGGQGRRRDAHELLAPVYGWFIEGLDTADLKNARVLLDTLA
jgi:predicted ATPase